MNCPKCDAKMEVTHSYSAGGAGNTQRLICTQCPTIVTAAIIMVAVNPKYGQGAASVARKMSRSRVLPNPVGVSVQK